MTPLQTIEKEIAGIRRCYEHDMTPSPERFKRIEDAVDALQGKPIRPRRVMVVDAAFDDVVM